MLKRPVELTMTKGEYAFTLARRHKKTNNNLSFGRIQVRVYDVLRSKLSRSTVATDCREGFISVCVRAEQIYTRLYVVVVRTYPDSTTTVCT